MQHPQMALLQQTMNSTKTELTLIGSRQKLSTLSECHLTLIDNVLQKQVSSSKSIGILNNNDNMAYIDKLFKKIASGIGAIKRIKPFVSPEILHYITAYALRLPLPMMLTLGTCYNNLIGKDLSTQRQIQVALTVFKALDDLAPD